MRRSDVSRRVQQVREERPLQSGSYDRSLSSSTRDHSLNKTIDLGTPYAYTDSELLADDEVGYKNVPVFKYEDSDVMYSAIRAQRPSHWRGATSVPVRPHKKVKQVTKMFISQTDYSRRCTRCRLQDDHRARVIQYVQEQSARPEIGRGKARKKGGGM